MTKTDPRPRTPFLCLLLAACLAAAGCGNQVEIFPEPGSAEEPAQIVRNSATGCIVVAFSPYPYRAGAPTDGLRRAVETAIGRAPCSAATFYWSEKPLAERWLNAQIQSRRQYGQPIRVVLAGHGLGATEAAETAREMIIRDPTVEVTMLLTLDAVKPGKINYAAGAAGAAVNRITGVNMSTSLVAYDSAPPVDGVRLLSHINYYQTKNSVYHGAAIPGAENHLLDDWSGFLNHGNIDDFAYPLLTADLRAGIARGMR